MSSAQHDSRFADPQAPFGREHGPHLTDAFAPIDYELELTDLPVEGEIPSDLNGVYLRNGPNQQFKPKGVHHYFDGQGMIHSGVFRNGTFSYRNKWIRTEGWNQNEAAGEELFWGVMNSHKASEDKPMSDAANTDVIGHAGNAVVSWYLAGIPHVVDPLTLETLRAAPEYVSGPGMGMSAHCKVDEHTGDMMFFDYFTSKPHMSYGVVSAEGKLLHHVPVELPGDRLMHDMGVSENYSILHDVPVYHDEEALKAGRHKIRFDSSLPIRFGVIPRFGAADTIQWFEFSSCFLYHVVNCWEEGDEVVMVACRYMPARKEDGSIDEERTARMIASLEMDARLWCYRMNVKTGETSETCLNADHNVEFPSYNSAETGRYTEWAYLVDHDPKQLRWTGIRKMNTVTGESAGEWTDGHADCWYSEPWFAPADNPRSEDHGYVVSFCWNARTEVQELQVFDALDISKGPVARVKLPQRIPPGFHACWMKASQVASWAA
ncbi:lignostilbene-alpha,beta-dioxygenase [Halioglobus japonicus]|uniref:Lignostilbene-alpha,beta-dioxygenase n=1 Tax=Halioglobus japonicus TaxID=930805 RepID=A0AAP8MDL6_9GAMM|nr:carotenoid oxygenase family protein [Halioglobus japonicus]AQA17652.1 lignostilbene-alpha,beta-dioxygenase [Halioglobus japonicus]PLW85597.1 lignostilbene-alpha,beta-dioxygenase [Halioglobus japonicus]GHD16459.1 carotenoid cleavage dioxygenase [Halioglobus japonicus]